MFLDQSFVRGFNKRDILIVSDVMVVECFMYVEVSIWLVLWLFYFYGVINSKVVVFDILKYCFNFCGRFFFIVFLDFYFQQVGYKIRGKIEDVEVVLDKEFKVFLEYSKMFLKGVDNVCIYLLNLMVLEEILEVKQVGVVMDVFYE